MGNKFAKKSDKKNRARLAKKMKYKLNAKKNQSKRVWTSFGIGIDLVCFMSNNESCHLQRLNKFAYQILVSRVLAKKYNVHFPKSAVEHIETPIFF